MDDEDPRTAADECERIAACTALAIEIRRLYFNLALAYYRMAASRDRQAEQRQVA